MPATADNVTTLAEALKTIDSGMRFDIEFVTADVKRGTGGQLKTVPGCTKHTSRGRESRKEAAALAQGEAGGGPAHFINSTRNLYDLTERKIFKVHIRLITRINGKQIL